MGYNAHIKEKSDEIQTVLEHNLNTAVLAKQFCDLEQMQGLAYITGLLHDAGKNTQEFQIYLEKAHKDPKLVVKGEVTHSTGGACIATSLAKREQMEVFTMEMIRHAIISHHGLNDCISLDGEIKYKQREEKEKHLEEITKEVYSHISHEKLRENFAIANRDNSAIVKDIVEFIHNDKKHGNLNFYFGMCERLLSSLLIDADRTDTNCFMNEKPIPKKPKQEEINLIWDDFAQKIEAKLKRLNKKNKHIELNKNRKQIADECLKTAKENSNIIRLVVPTGAGKTLSAFRYAVNHAKIHNKKRIIYIAPYNSILEQNAKVVGDILQANENILEFHCNIVADDYKYDRLNQTWDIPIVFTSAVQFFDTLFSDKTSALRRMHSLVDAIIIIDEVQSVPIKCVKLFNLASNFLYKICNTTMVLCSATQPLLDKLDDNSLIQPINMVSNANQYFSKFKRTEIVDYTKKVEGGMDIDDLANTTLEMINDIKNILVIVNTKSVASKLFLRIKELKEDIKIFHLSTNMCPKHRKDAIEEIKSYLGSDKKMICVSTQLIEAGVDISFQGVIRSLAGLDSIIQAGGRCNRNGENDLGKVYIVKIKDEDIGKLIDIKIAQKTMESILNMYKEKPEDLDNDLLSEKAMDMYYQYYFMHRRGEMDYNIPKLDTNIVTLLSKNKWARDKVKEKIDMPILGQAFKTAGENFNLIDEKGMLDIVVDYDNYSKKLINDMNSDISIERQREILRDMQQYSVSISSTMENDLKDGRYQLNNKGIIALRVEYYNEDIGVSTKPREMDLLIH